MTVEVERTGHVLVVSIQREEKRNALNAEITAGVDAAMNELEDDGDLWCGVLTGTATVFSAGADLGAGTGGPTPRGGEVGLVRRARRKPLIAAVEGYAVGGGLELVLSCDLVVASTEARFGFPEVKRGLMPDYGGTFRSVRMLPPNVARELLLTGDFLRAVRAERLGFVNVLAEPGRGVGGSARARPEDLRERAARGAGRARQRQRGRGRGRAGLLGDERPSPCRPGRDRGLHRGHRRLLRAPRPRVAQPVAPPPFAFGVTQASM